jgi:hypothetical protein
MEEKDIKKDIEPERCDANGCGCNVNYLLGAIAVIFIVMYLATTIK